MTTPRQVSKKKTSQRKSAKKASAKVIKKAAKKAANKIVKKAAKKATKQAAKSAPIMVVKKAVVRTAKQKAFVKKKPSTPAPAQEIGPDVLELIAALDAYKLKYTRPFPGWSEVLYVLKSLGYSKP